MEGSETGMKPIHFRDRVSNLAKALSGAGIDAYVGTRLASLHYLTGAFIPWRGAVVVTASGEAALIYWALDSERVRQESWGIRVREWGGNQPGLVDCIVALLQERGFSAGRIGLDLFIVGAGREAPGLLFAHEFMDLQKKMPQADLVNGTEWIDHLMMIKEPEEVERLALAAEVAKFGLEAGIAVARPGITENMIAGAIENAIRAKGSIWSWSVTGGTEVGSGFRSAFKGNVTQQATNKVVGQDEFIILDVHPMIDLYLADYAMPVFLGSPGREQQELIDCWEEIVEFMFFSLKPGGKVAEICKEALEIYSKYGLQDFGLPTFGHGLGTCARLRPFLHVKSEDVLAPGMVFALGTHLYKPGIGGLRLEHPVVVTEAGVRSLTSTLPKVQRLKI
jgi:Xaa-Pro aminopeptidase